MDLLAAVVGVPGVRLVVIGDGPARASVEKRTWSAVGDELVAHDRAACGLSTLDDLAVMEPAQPVAVLPASATRRAPASIG